MNISEAFLYKLHNQQNKHIWDNDKCFKLLQSYIFHIFEWINIARSWQTFVKAPGKLFQKGESSCYNRIFKVGDSQKFITFPAIHQISRHETFHCQIDKALQNKKICLEQDKFNRQTWNSEKIGVRFEYSVSQWRKYESIFLRFKISKIF